MNPILGQLMIVGFNFAPRNWTICEGQITAISSNAALYALLGDTFGGNGITTFGMPDLRGRSIVGVGYGPGLDGVLWGEKGGYQTTTLLPTNLPAHSHTIESHLQVGAEGMGSGATGTAAGNYLGNSTEQMYRTSPGSVGQNLNGLSVSISSTGNNVPINIQDPFLGMYINICIDGVFPSRN